MGVENRDYYRQNNAYDGTWGDWGLYHLTPVVKYIIVINVVVFLAQSFITRKSDRTPLEQLRLSDPRLDRLLSDNGEDVTAPAVKKAYPHLDQQLQNFDQYSDELFGERVSVVQEWGELDTKKLMGGQVWRLLTHAFLHHRYGIFDILVNMIFLYWFGCTIESMYGSREFLLFYLAAVLVGGLAFVALDLATAATTPGVGSWSAVLAVTMLYATHFPRETICLFWVLRVEMRWLMVGLVLYNLHPILLSLGGERMFARLGNAAHLGGLVFGFLYSRYQWRLSGLLDRLPSPAVPAGGPDLDMDRVDDLLLKISRTGESSLTDDERTFLCDASSRMKRRRRP